MFLRNNVCKKNAVSYNGLLKSQRKEVKHEAYIVIMIITGQVSCAVKFGISASFKLSLGGHFYPKHEISLSLKVVPLCMEMQEQFIEWNVMLLSTFHRPQKFLPTMQKRLSKMIFKDKQDKNKKGKDPKQQQQQPQQQVQGENTQSKINKQQLLRQQQQQIQVRTFYQKERIWSC